MFDCSGIEGCGNVWKSCLLWFLLCVERKCWLYCVTVNLIARRMVSTRLCVYSLF